MIIFLKKLGVSRIKPGESEARSAQKDLWAEAWAYAKGRELPKGLDTATTRDEIARAYFAGSYPAQPDIQPGTPFAMATKLDETFIKAALEKHPEAAYYIHTLALDVRRLELQVADFEKVLTDNTKTKRVYDMGYANAVRDHIASQSTQDSQDA